MSDPLSISAGIAGFISLGLQVGKSLAEFYSEYKDQDSNIIHLLRKLDGLTAALQNLSQHSSKNPNFSEDEKELALAITDSITECGEYIDELQRQCDKFAKAKTDDLWAKTLAGTRRLAYPLRKTTLKKIEGDIDEVISNISLILQVLQQRRIDDIQQHVEEIKQVIHQVRATGLPHIMSCWLQAPDCTSDYESARKKSHKDTGKWFVLGEEFTSWLGDKNSFLWVKGFAGCGKSVLCSTAIQHTLQHQVPNSRVGLAFFFFRFDNPAKQDASGMLRTLVLQLSAQQNDGYSLLSEVYRASPHSKPSDEVLMTCLRKLIQSFDDVYVFLDALDESPRYSQREGLLDVVSQMRVWKEDKLHLLTTSRDEADIFESLGAPTCPSVALKNKGIDQDIASFVEQQLQEKPRLRKWTSHHDLIKRHLVNDAGGVFRWVECQLIMLERCLTPLQLKKTLNSLPQSLNQTYERILLNVDENLAELAARILKLVCCAADTMTICEVIHAAAVDLGESPCINVENMLQAEEDLAWVCPGLLDVSTKNTKGLSLVRIAHFSVREYLESTSIGQSSASRFHVSSQQSHEYMACVCLTYIMEISLRPDFVLLIDELVHLDDFQLELYEPQFDVAKHVNEFLGYAVTYWTSHYRRSGQEQTLSKLLIRRLLQTDKTSKFLVIMAAMMLGSNQPPPLRYFLKYGMSETLSYCLIVASLCETQPELGDSCMEAVVNLFVKVYHIALTLTTFQHFFDGGLSSALNYYDGGAAADVGNAQGGEDAPNPPMDELYAAYKSQLAQLTSTIFTAAQNARSKVEGNYVQLVLRQFEDKADAGEGAGAQKELPDVGTEKAPPT